MSKPDIAALLAEARRPERTVELCLRGDLQARLEDLERELGAAHESESGVLADGAEAYRIAGQIQVLREQMKDSTAVFRLRAMTRKAWAELVAAHPPARDDEIEQALGYHPDSFFPALIRASAVDPELTAEQWDRLIDDTLTSRQYDDLIDTTLALNRRPIDVPFSPAASRTLRASEPK